MRSTLIAFTSIGLLAVVLAACGGGSSSTPAAPSLPVPQSTAQVVNGVPLSGPTGKVTITLSIPKRTPASAALHAAITQRFGSKSKSAFIRSIMNTSPTAAVRAYGLAQNQRAKAAESTRKPDYISNSGQYVNLELVLANGSTVAADQYQYEACYEPDGTCSVNFNVPAGTNYTAALYLSEDCGYITSAGTATGVNVAPGSANTPLPIIANPVVAYFDVTSTYTPVTNVPNSGFAVNVTPYDADDEAVTAPGLLLDGSFDQIETVTLTPTTSDVSPAGPSILTVPTNLTGNTPYVGTQTYTSSGPTGAVGSNEEWDAAEGTVGSQIVPSFNTDASGPEAPPGNEPFVTQVQPLSMWIGPDPQQTIPTVFGLPYYAATPPPAAATTTSTIEVAEPTPGPDIYLAVLANYPFNNDNLSLSSNNCADSEIQYGIGNAFPSPPPVVANGSEFPFSLNSSGTSGTSCNFTIYDSTSGLTANAVIQLDGANNVIINGKARK